MYNFHFKKNRYLPHCEAMTYPKKGLNGNVKKRKRTCQFYISLSMCKKVRPENNVDQQWNFTK